MNTAYLCRKQSGNRKYPKFRENKIPTSDNTQGDKPLYVLKKVVVYALISFFSALDNNNTDQSKK